MKIVVANDSKLVNFIRTALKENGGYCPCQFEHSVDTKCPCKLFREQATEGSCHCGLYIKIKDE